MDGSEAALALDAATRWELGPCTALALLRVQELFGTPLPADWTVIGRVADGSGVTVDGKSWTGASTGWDHFR